ncbi:hypothetical protein CHLNCDRAFT_134529 [Chlorella variabilis]|uniref:Mechanosensitive ion channel MscS domain-containing protein n=1 Tax=Chlorella variabilis TaxID=554065 RepID=E1ZG58_CHLVA|nr:hypothetical protein CHLNCDRAFT_134529 [Chlorella variabilis]EFN55409.1 hypothetical protein CHLNCDRAFT_134529 [Chlorella variabilis]|eukprot:XP_005847511.1 hypothetical protein CHLNCDRAFT_134529 [Chlorella variabilis]
MFNSAGEGGWSAGAVGLSSEALAAAYGLQHGLPGDDDRRASSTSSVGGEGFYSPAGSVHGGAAARVSLPAHDHQPRVVQRSHARSVPSPPGGSWHHAGGSGSPSLAPHGVLSPPPSPTHHSRLGPGGWQRDSRHPAARAEQDGGDWEEQYGRCPPSPPSLTFAPQYQQYQVLGGTGSPQLLDHLPPSQQEQEQQEAEEQQQERQAQLSPDSAALLASAAGAAAAAAKRASVPAGGEGRQWRGHAATFHQLQRVPSFGFAPTPADGMQRRATTGLPPPQDPFAAAGLAAAAAAAAAATCQQLAAGEQQRRQAEQREEERLGAAEARTGTVCFAEAGLEKESSEGKCVGVSAEPSSSAAITTDGDELGLAEIAAGRKVRWYQRWSFWGRFLSFTISLAFFLTGIVTLVEWPDVKLACFNLWRWCFFLGCWPLIYWASVWAMWALTQFCEWRLFAARTAVYFLVGTRGALMLVLRSCLVLAAFAALFQTQPNLDEDAAVQKVFLIIIKLLGCMVLMTVANLVKKVLIKLMATHFHKEAHFGRVQEALRKEYFLSVLSQPREHRDSVGSEGQVAGGAAPHPKSFAKRWLSRQFLSKARRGGAGPALRDMPACLGICPLRSSGRGCCGVALSVAAMHTLPSMVRSFTGRSSLQRSQSDSLLVEGRQLSDGSLAGPGRGGGPSRHSTAQHSTAQHSAAQRSTASASFLPNKPSQAAGAALASISVMVGAGVQPSCRSMPNLHTLSSRPSLPAGSQRPSQADAWQHSSQAEAQQQPGVGLEAGGVPAAGRDPRWSDPQAAAAPGLAPLQRQPSRLGRAAGAGGSFGGEGRGSAEAPPGQPQPQRQLAGQLSRTLSPTGAAMEQVAAAAARPELRASLASLQTSALSSLPAARQSYAFRVTSKQGSLASLRSTGGGGGKAAPPLQQLLDLGHTREQLRARHRRTSIVQMPPEELEKMQHIEKHIRKNQLKARAAGCAALTLVDHLGNLKDKPGANSNEQERCHLALTLRDAKSVISKLERLLGCIIHTLCIFFYLAIFNIDVTQAWLTFSSIMLAFTFIFGNSIRTVFECVVWLFVVHPYDVGDTLVLTGENHKVEEITLLITVLARWDGARVYWPNSRLNNEQLFNLSRSTNKSEVLKLSLDLVTPLEVVEMLRGAVEAHLKANTGEFTGSSSVNVRALGDPMKLTIGIWYEFSHNGVDAGRCARARSALYMMVAAALNAADVHFTLPPFPGDAAAGRAYTALERQAELAEGMGLPAAVTGAAR